MKDSHKATFELRLRASLAAPNPVWDLNPRFPWLLRFWSRRYESTHAQDHLGELPDGCWSDSNSKPELDHP
jgi:hypothetical protein